MARKKRDYKAEYAAAKRRATRSGYRSEREYKAVRKSLGLPRGVSPVPKRIMESAAPHALKYHVPIGPIREQNKRWSESHSRSKSSTYDPDATNGEAIAYHNAFIRNHLKDSADKKRRIYDYLNQYADDLDDGWESPYLAYLSN